MNVNDEIEKTENIFTYSGVAKVFFERQKTGIMLENKPKKIVYEDDEVFIVCGVSSFSIEACRLIKVD